MYNTHDNVKYSKQSFTKKQVQFYSIKNIYLFKTYLYNDYFNFRPVFQPDHFDINNFPNFTLIGWDSKNRDAKRSNLNWPNFQNYLELNQVVIPWCLRGQGYKGQRQQI